MIEDGFYYDFAFERPFTPEDLAQIEERMRELAHANIALERSELPRDKAIALFESLSEHYKCEIIRDLPADATISLYRQGDFIDLCRGPHVPSTGKLKAFKLMKVAGAYWRGDAKNAMLQRIYGTCWTDEKSLKAYLTRLEEAGKRDHRKLGAQLDLFHFDECAPGSVFWHSKGWALFQQLIAYMRDRQQHRLRRSEHTGCDGSLALGNLRSLGQLSRPHVHHRNRRWPHLCAQTDELSRRRGNLCAGHQELSRPADPHG